MFDGARTAQKLWAKTPLWRRAEMLKKAAALMRENAAPMADCLIKEVAKPKKVHRTRVTARSIICKSCHRCSIQFNSIQFKFKKGGSLPFSTPLTQVPYGLIISSPPLNRTP